MSQTYMSDFLLTLGTGSSSGQFPLECGTDSFRVIFFDYKTIFETDFTVYVYCSCVQQFSLGPYVIYILHSQYFCCSSIREMQNWLLLDDGKIHFYHTFPHETDNFSHSIEQISLKKCIIGLIVVVPGFFRRIESNFLFRIDHVFDEFFLSLTCDTFVFYRATLP
jgi:hypothetical protein